MFSIHIFVIVLLLKTLLTFLLQSSLVSRNLGHWLCKPCRSLATGNLIDSFVSSALRLILVGFFEIMLCQYIGYGIFSLYGSMTGIDKLTAITNVFYTVCLIGYSATVIYFVLIKFKPVIKHTALRD